MVRPTRIWWFAGMALAAAALGLALHTSPVIRLNYEHAMTELTNNMRPFCIGRFVVDVPAGATIRTFGQSIEGMGEITVHPNISRAAFLGLATRKEQALRVTPHRKEGTLLREAQHLDAQDTRILVYRDTEFNVYTYDVHGYFWRDMTGFEFAYGADNDRVEESKAALRRAFQTIRPRHNDDIPVEPGLCINNAFIPGQEYRAEDTGVLFTLRSYPGMEFRAHFTTTEHPDVEGLIARSDRNMPAVRELHPNIEVSAPRSGKRILAGMSGEELLELSQQGKPDAAVLATWEYRGEARSLVRPQITLDLTYGNDGDGPPPPAEKHLSNEEVMTLWDAFTQSLRPRQSTR